MTLADLIRLDPTTRMRRRRGRVGTQSTAARGARGRRRRRGDGRGGGRRGLRGSRRLGGGRVGADRRGSEARVQGAVPKDAEIERQLVAFANERGGRLYLGVTDDGLRQGAAANARRSRRAASPHRWHRQAYAERKSRLDARERRARAVRAEGGAARRHRDGEGGVPPRHRHRERQNLPPALRLGAGAQPPGGRPAPAPAPRPATDRTDSAADRRRRVAVVALRVVLVVAQPVARALLRLEALARRLRTRRRAEDGRARQRARTGGADSSSESDTDDDGAGQMPPDVPLPGAAVEEGEEGAVGAALIVEARRRASRRASVSWPERIERSRSHVTCTPSFTAAAELAPESGVNNGGRRIRTAAPAGMPSKPPSPPAPPAPPGWCQGRQVVWSSMANLLLVRGRLQAPKNAWRRLRHCVQRPRRLHRPATSGTRPDAAAPSLRSRRSSRWSTSRRRCSASVVAARAMVAAAAAAHALERPCSSSGARPSSRRRAVDVAVSSGHAFVVASSELTVVNVTDPMQPMVVGHVAPLSNAVRVAAKKDVAFVAENPADSDGSKLLVEHTIDKTMPTFFAMLTMPPDVQDIAYPGGDFFFAVRGRTAGGESNAPPRRGRRGPSARRASSATSPTAQPVRRAVRRVVGRRQHGARALQHHRVARGVDTDNKESCALVGSIKTRTDIWSPAASTRAGEYAFITSRNTSPSQSNTHRVPSLPAPSTCASPAPSPSRQSTPISPWCSRPAGCCSSTSRTRTIPSGSTR